MKPFKFNKPSAQIVTTQDAATPPQLPVPMVFGTTLRYRATADVTGLYIGFNSLRNLIFLADTTTHAWSLLQAVKLTKISLYVPTRVGSSTADPGNARILIAPSSLSNAYIGKPKSVSGSPVGTQGIKLVCKVPANTPVGDWHWVSSQIATDILPGAFELTAPEGSIIDLQMSFRFASDLTSSAALNKPLTCASATAGTFYYNHLDNTNISATTQGGGLLVPYFCDNVLAAPAYG